MSSKIDKVNFYHEQLANINAERDLTQELFGTAQFPGETLENVSIDEDDADIHEGSLDEEQEEPKFKSNKRRPVWVDDDDSDLRIRDVLPKQARKKSSDKSKKESNQPYSQFLKKQYANISVTPSWADLERKSKDKTEDDDDPLLKSVGDYLSDKSVTLPKGVISFTQMTDINKETRSEGSRIVSLEFHKSEQVAMIGGNHGVITLFKVDGKDNEKLQSVLFERFPLTAASFSANGDEIVATSHVHNHFHSYNLITGKVSKHGWNKNIDKGTAKKFKVSPDGKILAFLGRFGAIHIISAKTKEWIDTLKMNGEVRDVGFNFDGSRMYSTGGDGEVYVWDMTSRTCVHRFYDEGCIKGTSIAISPNQQFLATGSSVGVVNIYDTAKIGNDVSPRPEKVLLNLVTSVNSLKFNSTSELLGMASSDKENAIRLVHIPSFSVYSNFPSMQANYQFVKSLDFSANGGFAGVGNSNGRAMLFRLSHYKGY